VGIETVCRHRQKRRELFEFCYWRKYPLKDLHWVVEHPEGLSKRLLEQEARKALYSPSVGEGRRTESLKGSECLKKLRIDSTSVCMRRLCKECRS
jgi:hypothetical protein